MKRMKSKRALLLLAPALVLAVFLGGCDKREDTRQYVETIGVVFTNDIDVVFQELYVYPGDISEMGPDFIKNSGGITKVGSYGVTVEVSPSYNVWLKDRDGGSYEFEKVELDNADLAIISYDKKLLLTIQHHDGGNEVVEGRYIFPGDAPDHSQVPLKNRASYSFEVQNDTGSELAMISMREASDQYKGEVELYIKTLADGKSIGISGKLDEEDTDITEWVLHIETADGDSYTATEPFDPWEVKEIILTLKDGKLAADAK